MASPVVWIRQLSGASLDLSHSGLVAIRENLWVHIQCTCRFACFSCDGCIHGTWCVCVCARVCVRACVCVCNSCVINGASEAYIRSTLI